MVVVNVKADDGYAIDSVIATSESGFVYLVYGTTLEDGTKQYAFCMPNSDVSIRANTGSRLPTPCSCWIMTKT